MHSLTGSSMRRSASNIVVLCTAVISAACSLIVREHGMPIDSATRLLDFGMYLELQINFPFKNNQSLTILGRSLLVVDLSNDY